MQSDKALKLDPKNAAALTVKARSVSSKGRLEDAAVFLKDLPGLDKGGEQSEFLLDLYLKDSNWESATELALQTFDGDEKNFGLAQKVAEALMQSHQTDRALSLVSRLRIPMLDAGEHDAILLLLNDLAEKMPNRLEPLEWLVDTYGRTSDSFRMPDALAKLGEALMAAKQFPRAKEILEQLVDRQPDSEGAKRKLNDCLRKMGLAAPQEEPEPREETLQADIAQPEAPKLRPDVLNEPEETVPAAPGEPPLDEETQKFISQSLTDVDLFASYGLTQKAIGLLEAILRRAPNHIPTLEKLLDSVLGAGDDRRTAELAAQLERVHKNRADALGAERFGDLRRRFQRAAGLSDEDMAASGSASTAPSMAADEVTEVEQTPEELAVRPEEPVVAAAPVPPPPVVAPKAVPPPPPPRVAASPSPVHEVDLSDEWASMLEQGAPVEPPAPAKVKPAKPAAPPAAKPAPPEEFEISEFAIPIETPAIQEPAVASSFSGSSAAESAEEPEEETIELISADEDEEELAEVAPPPPARVPKKPVAAEPVPEIDLGQEYELVLTPETETDAPESTAPPMEAQPVNLGSSQVLESEQFLADLANEIDQLGLGELTPPRSDPAPKKETVQAAAPQAAAPLPFTENSPLQDVFDDFRAELGEMGAEDEDLETHYNLGIAFREMGLLEEAISEFQKVAKANENGKPFRYAMQCCTLLGLAFMEKGQPSIAAIWYERALHTPGVDSESILALRYDLGVAQESANDLDAALKSFSQRRIQVVCG